MDSTTPKVSFIPKGSLVRETAFLERRRPRSAIGFIAVLAFVASVGSYAGLYFYNDSLEKKVEAKTDEINLIQKKFSEAPQIDKAQVFRARTKIASELLDSHTLVSPVFTFLSDYTLGSILYEKFSFTRGADGATVELLGEAPSYAALAYQGDVLRERTKELSKFDINNVSLTKFGTVSFVLSLTFVPTHLVYADSLGDTDDRSLQEDMTIFAPEQGDDTSGISGAVPDDLFSGSDMDSGVTSGADTITKTTEEGATVDQKAKTITTTPPPEKQSMLKSLWSRFKFW